MEEHLNSQDRLLILQAIFNKHLLEKMSLHLVSSDDILLISGLSKSEYSKLVMPVYIGEKKMEYDDLRVIAMTEAFISYMNLNHLARKEIKINYKRSK